MSDGYMNRAGFACSRAEYEAEAMAGRVKRLQDAIEGECDGLAISDRQAAAILGYLGAVTTPSAVDRPAHSKSEYRRRVAMGDPTVTPPPWIEDAAKLGWGPDDLRTPGMERAAAMERLKSEGAVDRPAEPTDVQAMSAALSAYMDEADRHGHQVSGADFGAGYRAGAMDRPKGSTEDALRMALQMLYDDTADYITRNNLGALNNHAMRLAREALAASPAGAPADSPAQAGNGWTAPPLHGEGPVNPPRGTP